MINKFLSRFGMPEIFIPAVLTDFSDKLLQTFNDTDNLFIHGDVGTRKTWLLSALMRDTLEKTKSKPLTKYDPPSYQYNSLFISLPELMLKFRSTMQSGATYTEADILDKYSRIKYLYFDDIGSEKTTEYVRASLFLLIDRRANQTSTRTLITSNLSLNEIANQHGKRIASRITGMCKVIKLTGADRRLK